MPRQDEQEEDDDETWVPEDLRDYSSAPHQPIYPAVYMQSFRCPTTWTVFMLWTKQPENMKRNGTTGHEFMILTSTPLLVDIIIIPSHLEMINST
jgi:hypothetical protein